MYRDNIKKIGGFVGIIFLLTMVSLPAITYSAETGGTGITYECANGGIAGNCTFADVIAAIQKVVKYAVTITIFLSVVVIAVAGFKYMISGDNAGARKEANEMLRKTAIGMVFIIAAWLIVTLITTALLNTGINTFLG